MWQIAQRVGLCLLVLQLIWPQSGCAGNKGTSALRPAMDQPVQFMIETTAGRSAPKPGGDCHNPLVDPRDGTRLTLVRSAGGTGDYAVSVGRYGVREGELLRIDCSTGRAIGIVKQ